MTAVMERHHSGASGGGAAPARRDVTGLRVVVVGAARSGVAAARLLAAHGARVIVTDTRERLEDAEPLRALGVDVELGPHRGALLAGAGLVVLSPGVPPRQPPIEAARAAGVPVVGEMELASWWLEGPVVAVTGTKGKSTTTTLIGRMLGEAGRAATVGGNIGAPLSGQVRDTGPGVVHVVEASSFQLEAIDTFRPAIAVLLNLSTDHLDRHESVEEYAAAKARVFENQQPGDHAVVNADDPRALALAGRTAARVVRFALEAPLEAGVAVRGDTVAWVDPGGRVDPLVPLASVRLRGRHLLADVLAACAVARLLGVATPAMVRAVEAFTGLEHVLEPVAEIAGVRFVNDSKATNVDAARRAIESFPPGLVVIMGGRFKGGDLGTLREPLAARRAAVVAIGEARALFADALAGAARVEPAASLDEAVRRALALASSGDTVLLAPACASFDMFRDYAERGRSFKAEVGRLVAEVDAGEP